MKNMAHIAAHLQLLLETDLDKESFLTKFNLDTLVGCKFQLITPDGSVHNASFADLTGFELEEFENNREQ